MRAIFLAPLLLLGMEAAALACSCAPADTPEQSRDEARQLLTGAVAIVEADILAGYDREQRRSEQVRVAKTLWGKAPRTFQIDRARMPNSAMCDIELAPGKKRVLILYPGRRGPAGARRYMVQNLCADYLVSDPRYLPITLQEARRR
jgi:hypothetical protein